MQGFADLIQILRSCLRYSRVKTGPKCQDQNCYGSSRFVWHTHLITLTIIHSNIDNFVVDFDQQQSIQSNWCEYEGRGRLPVLTSGRKLRKLGFGKLCAKVSFLSFSFRLSTKLDRLSRTSLGMPIF